MSLILSLSRLEGVLASASVTCMTLSMRRMLDRMSLMMCTQTHSSDSRRVAHGKERVPGRAERLRVSWPIIWRRSGDAIVAA